MFIVLCCLVAWWHLRRLLISLENPDTTLHVVSTRQQRDRHIAALVRTYKVDKTTATEILDGLDGDILEAARVFDHAREAHISPSMYYSLVTRGKA